jgi:purine catabolism regulator
MLTLRDLLRDLDLALLAGEGGLDLPVRWVHISELDDPTPWLSGGELLLTTGLQLGTPESQREFVSRLADHQLVGMGFGTGFTHESVPPAILEVAGDREFPVFEVPYELPFIAITEAAFSQLVNEQYAVLRRALAAQERLERIVLSERGLEAVAGTLATLIGATVIVFDSRGEPMLQRAFRRALDAEALRNLQADVRERARRREASAFVPSAPEGNQSLALPVAPDGAPENGANGSVRAPQAWLVAIKDSGSLSDFDRLTLHQAVTLVALELLRSRVAGDTERRLAGDLFDALVRGELSGAELARRLAPFGLVNRVAAIVIQGPPDGRGSSAPLESAVGGALRDEGTPALVASTGSLTCALVPGIEDEELFSLARLVATSTSSMLDAGVRVGVGRAVASGEAKRSFHEARCALESLTMTGHATDDDESPADRASSRVATYRDLGSFQLLLSLQDDEALRLYCDSILGPIEASEGHYGGELMRSLEAFIEENGQWERAAKRLYCHRHTLRYRIRRVEELTGRNLSTARDRIEFWLALRGRELVA